MIRVCEHVPGGHGPKCGRPAKYVYTHGLYTVLLCGLHSKSKLKQFPERMRLLKPEPTNPKAQRYDRISVDRGEWTTEEDR